MYRQAGRQAGRQVYRLLYSRMLSELIKTTRMVTYLLIKKGNCSPLQRVLFVLRVVISIVDFSIIFHL